MHIMVNITNLCVDDFTVVKRGLNWFDEKRQPKMKTNFEKIIAKFPNDVEIVKGLDSNDGIDFLGMRSAQEEPVAVVEEVVIEEDEENNAPAPKKIKK